MTEEQETWDMEHPNPMAQEGGQIPPSFYSQSADVIQTMLDQNQILDEYIRLLNGEQYDEATNTIRKIGPPIVEKEKQGHLTKWISLISSKIVTTSKFDRARVNDLIYELEAPQIAEAPFILGPKNRDFVTSTHLLATASSLHKAEEGFMTKGLMTATNVTESRITHDQKRGIFDVFKK